VLVNTAPFFIVVLGRLFRGVPIPRPVTVGLLAGFAGVVLVVRPSSEAAATPPISLSALDSPPSVLWPGPWRRWS
jgi:drug/metabolite transporter (DMT)-like permease